MPLNMSHRNAQSNISLGQNIKLCHSFQLFVQKMLQMLQTTYCCSSTQHYCTTLVWSSTLNTKEVCINLIKCKKVYKEMLEYSGYTSYTYMSLSSQANWFFTPLLLPCHIDLQMNAKPNIKCAQTRAGKIRNESSAYRHVLFSLSLFLCVCNVVSMFCLSRVSFLQYVYNSLNSAGARE